MFFFFFLGGGWEISIRQILQNHFIEKYIFVEFIGTGTHFIAFVCLDQICF